MVAILIPVMRKGSIELYLAHHICRLTPSSVPVTNLCEVFAMVGVNATPLQPKPQIIQIRPDWFDQEEDVVVTPSFNCLVEAVTDDKLSKLNTFDLEDPSSLNKSFKPRKVMPIPPNVAATIGRYKPLEVGLIFSACAQEIIDTSTNNSSDDCGIQWEILNSSDEVENGSSTDRARAYLPILQFIWLFLKGTKQSTPYVNTDSMKISAESHEQALPHRTLFPLRFVGSRRRQSTPAPTPSCRRELHPPDDGNQQLGEQSSDP